MSSNDQNFELESLEPRLLLSADPLVGGGVIGEDGNGQYEPLEAVIEFAEEEASPGEADTGGEDIFAVTDTELPEAETVTESPAEEESETTETASTFEGILPESDDAFLATASEPLSIMADQSVETLNAGQAPPEAGSGYFQLSHDSDISPFSPQRPMLIVPGIAGTFAAPGAEETWYTERGIAPEYLTIDPLAGFYDDISQTLQNFGYTLGSDLFEAVYDWRMAPGPAPTDNVFDGVVEGLTADSLTDDTYEFSVDYLGYWMKEAVNEWTATHGSAPEGVDIISHSTGGLVARTYIQSTAYNTQTADGDLTLPQVHNFIMVGVPNRGAPKAWNPLHNDWSADPSYQIVLSKVVTKAYDIYLSGELITGADGDIQLLDGQTPLNEEEFIFAYSPTIRALLATYDFIFPEGSNTEVSANDFEMDQTNLWILDLNDGLDQDYSYDEYVANTGDADGRDPNSFATKIKTGNGGTLVLYSNGTASNAPADAEDDGKYLKTAVSATQFTGPQSPGDVITTFEEFYGHFPAVDEGWFRDNFDPDSGDGTVPTKSSLDQFVNDARVDNTPITEINPGDEEEGLTIGHTGLMSNIQLQKEILRFLGAAESEIVDNKISTELANGMVETLAQVISLQILDPLELLQAVNWTDFSVYGLDQAFAQGVQSLGTKIGELSPQDEIPSEDTAILNRRIPFTQEKFSDLLDFQNVFNTYIGVPLVQAFQNSQGSEEVVDTIKTGLSDAGDFLGGYVDFNIDTDAVRGGLLSVSQALIDKLLIPNAEAIDSLEEILFYVPFEFSRTSDVPINLGEFAAMQGFQAGLNATAEFTAHLSATLVLGFDLRSGLSSNQRFFVRVDEFDASVESDISALNAAMNVGILGTNISNGSVQADAGLKFSFAPDAMNERNNITLAELLSFNGDFDSLMTVDPASGPYASLNANLPINVNYDGLNLPGSPLLTITGDNLFEEQPEIALSGFGGLIDFAAVSLDAPEDVLENIKIVFLQMLQAPEFQESLPFVNDLPLESLLGLSAVLDTSLVDSLRNDDGMLAYTNLQEFVALANDTLSPADSGNAPYAAQSFSVSSIESIGGVYNAAAKTLNFSFSYDFSYLIEEQNLDFNYNLEPLEIFVDGGNLTVSADGILSFEVAMGMETPVAAVTAQELLPTDGILPASTTLEILLNGGALSFGEFVQLELDPDPTNTTPEDLVADINTAIAASQLAGLINARAVEGKLVLETTFTGPLPSLGVRASANLGLTDIIYYTHQPSAFAEISNLSASLSTSLDAGTFTAAGRIGFVGVFVQNGSANLDLDLNIDLLPGGSRNVKELFVELADDPSTLLPDISITGTGSILLQGITVDGGIVADPGSGASIEVSLALGASYPIDPADGAQFDVSLNGDFTDILKFRSLDFADMVQLLRDSLGVLEDLTQGDFLNQPIPFIGGSVNELLDSVEAFTAFLDELEQNAPATIQNFAAQLTDSIQDILDESFPTENIQPEVLVTFGQDDVLVVDFKFLASAFLELAFELDPLGNIPGLGAIVDLKMDTVIEATLAAWAQFVIGIDLSNPSSPTVSLIDGTEAVFEILLSAEDINFAAAAPLGFFVRGGSAHIDDGTPGRGPATASFAFNPGGTDRLALANVSFSDFDFSVTGQAEAELPVRFPIDSPSSELPTPITFSVNFQDLANPTFNGPDFEELFANVNLFDSLSDGLDLLFFAFEELADGEIFNFEIPFIGDQLADAASFILELRTSIESVIDGASAFTESEITNLLYDALGPDGLDFLLPIIGGGLPSGLESASLTDVRVDITGSGVNASNIEIEMRLGQLIELLNTGIEFGDGLPGLNLDFDTDLLIELGWEWRLIFGVNRTEGFYFKTDSGNEMTIGLDVSFPDTALSGSFGFLGFSAQTRPDGLGAGLNLNAEVDILPDAAPDTRITLSTLSASGGFSEFDVTLDGQAVLDLAMTLGFADLSGEPVDALPSFLVDFFFKWDFISASTSGTTLGGTPEVRFDNIRLDVGTFFSDFLRPIVETIGAYLAPLEPIVDFLTADLGFLNWDPVDEIFDENDDGHVTVLDLARLFGGNVSDTADDFLRAADMIFDILEAFDRGTVPGRDSNLTVSLGSYDFSGIDLRSDNLVSDDFFNTGNFSQAASSVADQFAALGGSAASIFAMTQEEVSSEEPVPGGGKFEFLLFDPQNLIGLIMGQPVDFFEYSMPEISFDFSFSDSYPVFAPPEVKVRFGFAVGFSAHLTFGYDSSGVTEFLQEDGEIGDLFGGFYVAVGEAVPPQLSLYGEIYGGASVGIFVASVNVDLGARLEADFSLIDPGEGKLYFWQIATLVENRGLFEAIQCLFITEGEVYGFAEVSVDVGIFTVFSVEVGRITFWEASGQGDDCFNFLIPDRLEQYEENLPNNDTRSFAADLGVAPGIHLRGASISSPGDLDYYRFELIKPESLNIVLKGHPDFNLTLFDADGVVLAAQGPGNDRKRLSNVSLPEGVYYIGIEAPDSDTFDAYELDINPSASSTTRVFYVNSPTADPPEIHSFYSLGVGDDSHADAGLHPLRPAATLDRVITLHSPTANDLILFDTGVYINSINLSNATTGLTIAGAPTERFEELPETVIFGSLMQGDGSAPAADISTTADLTLARFVFSDSETGLRITGSDGFRGVGLTFELNDLGMDLSDSDNAILEQTTVYSNGPTGTGLQVTDSSNFSLLNTEARNIDEVLVLIDSVDATVDQLTAETVENVIVATGGSGLSVENLDLEGAMVVEVDPVTTDYVGNGEIAISVADHSDLFLNNLDIRRYMTGLHLSNISVGTVSSVETLEGDVGLRGWGLNDLDVSGAHFISDDNAQAILIGLGSDPVASASTNISITQSTFGVLPPGDVDLDPIPTNVSISDTTGLTINSISLHGSFSGSSNANANWSGNSVINGGVHFIDSTNVTVTDTVFESEPGKAVTAIFLENVSTGSVTVNTIQPADGVVLPDDGYLLGTGIRLEASDGITVTGNDISRKEIGLSIAGRDGDNAATSTIGNNTFDTGETGIFVENTFTEGLLIESNEVTNYLDAGIYAIGFAEIVLNTVTDSGKGIRFEADTPGLFENVVTNNSIGLTGGGYLGNDDRAADRYNIVTENIIGIEANGDQNVAFNKVFANEVGVVISGDNVVLHHNLIYRNISIDLKIDGSSGSSVWNNTVYSVGDRAIHLTGESANTDIRNNIFWNVGGTVLDIDFPSADGLTSDYNTYYASGGAILINYIKTFDDLLDWQIEMGQDRNSLGTTRIDPNMDQPAFVNLAGDDFRIVDTTANSINSGDPSFSFDNEPGPNNGPNGLRINQGAFGDTVLAAESPSAYIRVLSPNYYLDYTREEARRVIWEFFNVTGNVSLELIEDGAGKVADITIVSVNNLPDQVLEQPASHGSYFWSPQMSGIAGNDAKRYFIKVIAAENSNLADENREAFSIPETTNQFYVNDLFTTDDVLTTSIGDNRNTGKTPGTPKAILPAILQNYSLAANQTLHVDTGNYLHLQDVVFSSADEFNNNEAFTLEGPSGDGTGVVFDRADPRLGSVGLLFDDASFVTVRNITLEGGYKGIEARNSSTFLNFENVILQNHEGIQMHIYGGSDRATIDNVRMIDGGGDGLVVDALLQYFRNSVVDNNAGMGVRLTDTGNTLLESNIISNNAGGGLDVYNSVSSTSTVVGNEDLSQSLGNVIRNNLGRQVEVRGNVLLAGNTVYHTDGAIHEGTGIGIYLWNNTVTRNIVAGHATGIYSYQGGSISENRIYNNSLRGIGLNGSSAETINRNVIYSSDIGIEDLRGASTGGDIIRNNLIYDFETAALKFSRLSNFVFENNTVYSATGDGLILRSSTGGVVVNNLFHLEDGAALNLDVASQTNLISDYNLFDLSGNGSVGIWAGGIRSTLQDWRNASFLDDNSLSADPLFVDVDGAANNLGYASPADDGRDDNFHLQSLQGSIRNGSLAPVMDATSELPVFLASSRVADGAQSPGIDRGDATYAFDLEPSPNGNFINIGAFGNTELASQSPAAYVLVTSPSGGETWPIEQTFDIEWRSQDFSGTVDIFLVQEGSNDPVATIATATENDGLFEWSLTAALAAADNYRVEVVRGGEPSVSGQSLNPFSISGAISFYYVNDSTVTADGYATAAGDNANNGLSPSTPKASIRAILDTYDLGEGDVILVDPGIYDVTTNIFIEANDSLVTIRGYYDPSQPELETILDRGNRADGAYIFELTGVTGLTLESLTFTNANWGVYAGDGLAPELTVRENRFIHNEDGGIYVDQNNPDLLVEGNYFEGSGNYTNGNGRQDVGIRYQGEYAVVRGNELVNNYTRGMYFDLGFGLHSGTYVIEGNSVTGSRYGIELFASGIEGLIRDNTLFGNENDGIYARGDKLIVTENIAYDNGTGLRVFAGALAIANTEIYDNGYGIRVQTGSKAIGNTVYNNTQGIRGENAVSLEDNIAYGNGTGIVWNHSTTVVGNIAYGNTVGMHSNGFIGSNSQWRASMYNNISYGNDETALLVQRTVGSPDIYNNTFVQAGAEGTVIILDDAENIDFFNNIVVADGSLGLEVQIDSQAGFYSDYNVYHFLNGASGFLWGDLAIDTAADWFFNVSADGHSVFADPMFVDAANANYHLRPDSPAIDAGDPASHYQKELDPSGARINAGAYGNTGEAAVSSSQSIQILDPVALDKLLQGNPAAINFITSGLLDSQSVAWFNTGFESVDRWLQISETSGVERESVTTSIDLSNVTDPAPLDVYRNNWRTDFGAGNSMSMGFDLAPGEYLMRLHFVDTAGNADEIFDLEINGELVYDDFSIFAEAGGRYIGLVKEVPVTVDADGRVDITITSEFRYGRIAGIEVRRATVTGTTNPSFRVEASFDNGSNFSTIASGVEVDRRGFGTVSWTPSQFTQGREGIIRIVSENNPGVTGSSNPFLVANSGTSYYVNDGSLDNDVYTTAIGDNSNDGKSPSTPMASLEALLAVYSPSEGDVIYVDSGTYELTRNIVLTAAESGILLTGAHDANNALAVTVLDRGNLSSPAYGIELDGADGITIEHLTITNAYRGIFADDGNANNLTVRNSRFIMNFDAGIFVDRDSMNLLVEDSYFEGNTDYNSADQDNGIFYGGTHAILRNNVFLDNYRSAIDVSSPSPNFEMNYLIEGNTITGGLSGIVADGWVNDALVRNNTVTGTNNDALLISGSRTIVTSNTIYGNERGISLRSGATATGNVNVYDNVLGIYLTSGSKAIDNIVHDNAEGIRAQQGGFGLIQDNVAYDNGIGYRFNHTNYVVGNVAYNNGGGFYADDLGSNSQFRGRMYNNVAFGNTNYALRLERTVGNPYVFNNTFVQTGEGTSAVVFDNASNVLFRNNIISVDGATALNVSANSQAGLDSDYNVFHLENITDAFVWGDRTYVTQADWFYNTSLDLHSRFADPQFVDSTNADFHLQSSSPAIDAGDPDWSFALEPIPSGGRLNAGAYGNTDEAATSLPQNISVLDPTFLDKPLQNGETAIRFHTSGFLDQQTVAWFNAGSSQIGGWTTMLGQQGGQERTNSSSINLDSVQNPAPESIYQQYLQSDFGAGERIDLAMELTPGDYVLRLHFTHVNSNSNYPFNIEVDGEIAVENFNISTVASAYNEAVIEEVPVTVDESGELTVSFVALERYAYISGIEVMRVNDSGQADPQFTTEVSYDNGVSFTRVANGTTVDNQGIGTVSWVPDTSTSGRTAIIRVVSASDTSLSGESEPLLVANDGNRYYVNDLSTENDVFTSVVGDNLNSGKDADSPMASLEALLAVHSPGAGDIIYVDAGTYLMTRNIVLTAENSGVTIIGTTDKDNTTAGTILDRSNRISPSYVFELAGAEDVTLENLTITNGYQGVHVREGEGSNLTIRNSRIVFNEDAGIFIDYYNPGFLLEDSFLEGKTDYNAPGLQEYGLETNSTHFVVRGSTFLNHYRVGLASEDTRLTDTEALIVDSYFEGGSVSWGLIYARENNTTIQRVTLVNGEADGLYLQGTNSVVRDSVAYGNADEGFNIFGGVTAENNIAYENNRGFYGNNGSLVRNNLSFENNYGMFIYNATAEGNRVYGNVNYGIGGQLSANITGNQIYNNDVGIRAFPTHNADFRGRITNNLLYSNGSSGILLTDVSSFAEITSNTIYQPTGNAIYLRDVSSARIHNNIFQVDAGFAINSDSLSLNENVTIDYNLFFLGDDPNARIGELDETFANTLSDWQGLSGTDANSLLGDPLFFDIDGSDDVLGYREIGGIFIDGGEDDNFHLKKLSPAIDRGYSWWSEPTDKDGGLRLDDPGVANAGGNAYDLIILGESQFDATRGTAQNWKTRWADYNLTLPFAFEFYGQSYTQIQVSPYGLIGFPENPSSTQLHTLEDFISNSMLAVFWAEVETGGSASFDIYVDTSVQGEVYIRWEAKSREDDSPVQFAALLKDDGSIRLDYGTIAEGLDPVIGVSNGNGKDYIFVDGYSGNLGLGNANSVEITLVPGIHDIGAYEFKGSSLDNLAPVTIGSLPLAIENSGNFFGFLDEITVELSEAIDSIDARSPSTFELIRDIDGDGQFTNADEFYTLTPIYDTETNAIRLVIEEGSLPDGDYRLRIQASNLRDVSGNPLDGDGSGSAGGDYVRAFSVAQPVLPEFSNADTASTVAGEGFSFQVTATNSPTAYGASDLPEGLTIDANTGLISGSPLESGSFEVTLTATNADGTSNMTLELSVIPVPGIIDFFINDGASESASMITQFVFEVDADVSDSLQASDFQIVNTDTSEAIASTAIQLNWSFSTSTITLTFPGLTGGSLPDGNYELRIASGAITATGVSLDGDGDGVQGSDFVTTLYRLYGDVTGNRAVDVLDGYRFRNSFGSASSQFDFNSDGIVDAIDREAFKDNYLSVLPESGLESQSEAAETMDNSSGSTPVSLVWSTRPIVSATSQSFSKTTASGISSSTTSILHRPLLESADDEVLWLYELSHDLEGRSIL